VGDSQAAAVERLDAALALASLAACRPPLPSTNLDCLARWLAALPAALTLQDRDRVRPLLTLIGRSHDPRARLPLEQQLGNVLSRADIVAALGTLGDRQATVAIGRLLRDDPYVHVRAAAAIALGQLGGPLARRALLGAAASEREAPVQAAIQAALATR
jgi:HEAT repeat protein